MWCFLCLYRRFEITIVNLMFVPYDKFSLFIFSLSNRLFLTLDSVKKCLFFTLELLFFTLEKKPDLDILRWRGA
jgi:hypothetical protein